MANGTHLKVGIVLLVLGTMVYIVGMMTGSWMTEDNLIATGITYGLWKMCIGEILGQARSFQRLQHEVGQSKAIPGFQNVAVGCGTYQGNNSIGASKALCVIAIIAAIVAIVLAVLMTQQALVEKYTAKTLGTSCGGAAILAFVLIIIALLVFISNFENARLGYSIYLMILGGVLILVGGGMVFLYKDTVAGASTGISRWFSRS